MNPLLPFLHQQGFLVLDGALATELERRGAQIDDPLWSALMLTQAPGLIREVHLDYFRAGADVAISASYQATYAAFARHGIVREEAARLMQSSVKLALEARELFWADERNRTGRIKPLVAASIGPYGAYLADGSEYRGDYGLTVEELIDFHRPRLETLIAAGPELLACETVPCRAEAEALIRLLAELASVPAWLTFSCCDECHLCHGEPLDECVALANESAQIVAVGVNCTPPAYVQSLLQRANGVTDKPLVAYPNSGELWDSDAGCWLPGTGRTNFSEPSVQWYESGARLIGGCCRTTPEDTVVIRDSLAERHRSS